MNKPTNIEHAPKDATHWAPETNDWLECYYRYENGLWYFVNYYWASDVDERPTGIPAHAWRENGVEDLLRPMTDIIEIGEFK